MFAEKQSRWMSFRAGVWRVWNAGKRLFQTNETQVCAFVPSQELPHTPSVEPTDPLESRPTDPLESRPTDPLESRTADPLESGPTDPPRSSHGRQTCPARILVQADTTARVPLDFIRTDSECLLLSL